MDHSKLNFLELCYGMDDVLLHLLKTGGDALSYASHKLFVSSQAKSNRFIDRAFVDYDGHVVDKVIEGESTLSSRVTCWVWHYISMEAIPFLVNKRQGPLDLGGTASGTKGMEVSLMIFPSIFAMVLIMAGARGLVPSNTSVGSARRSTRLWDARKGRVTKRIDCPIVLVVGRPAALSSRRLIQEVCQRPP